MSDDLLFHRCSVRLVRSAATLARIRAREVETGVPEDHNEVLALTVRCSVREDGSVKTWGAHWTQGAQNTFLLGALEPEERAEVARQCLEQIAQQRELFKTRDEKRAKRIPKVDGKRGGGAPSSKRRRAPAAEGSS